MATTAEKVPKDCTACRITGSVGLVGIGAYLANVAWKNKTNAGKIVISTLSLGKVEYVDDVILLVESTIAAPPISRHKYYINTIPAFVTLGVQRYKNQFPFHKSNNTFKTKNLNKTHESA